MAPPRAASVSRSPKVERSPLRAVEALMLAHDFTVEQLAKLLRAPSTWERRGDSRLRFSWLAFRGLDGEGDIGGPALEPIPGVEFVIASDIEVSVPVRDWKEKADLWPDAGNA